MMKNKKRAGSFRPVMSDTDLKDRFNERLRDGILLDKDISGEILKITLAPNETKIIPHGLRVIPKYRMFLRKTGAGEVTDVDANWTKSTIGLKNEGANTIVIIIKIFPG